MNAPFQNIVQHLFHQPSLHSVTVDELQRMASRHPTFAAAQFLLLKKLQETNDPGFGQQLQKTVLYFQNPLWLQYLLQPSPVHVEPELRKNTVVSEASAFDDSDEEELVAIEEAEDQEVVAEPAIEEAETESDEEEMIAIEEAADQEPDVDPGASEEEVIIVPDLPLEVAEGREPIYDQEPGHEPTIEYETPQAMQSERAWEEEKGDEPQVDATEKPEQSNGDDAEIPWKITDQSAKTEVLFEPFHTVDYFASQGIKTDKQEDNPQDRLGKQLKSFTGWLKSMKKLPHASVERLL
ncbi:MAG: hypothetical protein H7Y27_10290, partial [Gemmatimonadaceae bacterium]|nr:hypothetical protein [Chitinophagaceae bacterium]